MSTPRREALEALATAQAAAARGDWSGAVRALQPVAESEQTNPQLWRALSDVALRLRDYVLAVHACRKYAALLDDPRAASLDLARVLLDAHRLEDASDAAARALDHEASPNAHLIAGKCARLRGDLTRAEEHFRAAIALDANFGTAWEALSEIASQGSLDVLARDCDGALAAFEGHPAEQIRFHFALGQIHERRKHHDRAYAAIARGNALHHALRRQTGTQYRADQAERNVRLIVGHFSAVPARTAAPASGRRSIFIVGMPRTGTTLVERILLGLDGVGSSHENEAMEFVADAYYARLQARAPASGGLTEADWQSLAAVYRDRTPCREPVVIDKMPTNFHHVGLILGVFPDARIVHLQRDPRDVAWSIFARYFGDGHPYACSFRDIAHFHAQSEILMAHWRRTAPASIHTVNYEALVRDPEAASRQLASFCGLNWRASCLDIEQRREASFTFSELQVRRGINTDGIGRWKTYGQQLGELLTALRAQGFELG